MIDCILHSVQETEKLADQILMDAGKESRNIRENAEKKVAILWENQRESFKKKAEIQRKMTRLDEEKQDENAQAEIKKYLEKLKKQADGKSEQTVQQLIHEIV